MKIKLTALLSIAIFLISCNDSKAPSEKIKNVSAQIEENNPLLIIGSKNYLTGYEAAYDDGDINVVVEIPTGSVDKWEVDKESGNMKWEIRNGSPRKVNYLGYPGNYGMIPQTLLPYDLGGDGDPLDVIVLGPSVERGKVIKAKLVGVLKLLDGKEQDDKLIAVMEGTPFYDIDTIEELKDQFNGTTTIIETFFANYKGQGKMESLGLGDEREARKILDYAIEEYKNHAQL